jgi:IS5 family transposase
MGPKARVTEQDFFRQPLLEQINLKHPLVRLASLIDWARLGAAMSESFVSRAGRPATSPRLIAGLLYLQHAFDLSDEEVVWQWVENPYWQVFTGETFLQTEPPIDPSSLTRLLERCREHLVKAAARHGIKLRQNYNREAPRLALQIGRYAHAKQYKRMRKTLRTLRSRVGRVMRDVERQIGRASDSGRAALLELIARTRRILSQKPKDKNKLYALHAPEVECLAKGKVRTPYEFGVKVSITTTHKEGLVVGARSMPGNPYDGHTLAEALEQAAILSDASPEVAIVDRGYKGVTLDGVKIYHPGLRRGITRGPRAMIRRRSAIEPAIGHMKTDGKLDRNWLKGALGDAMHAVLCGAGHNLRMILRKLQFFYAFMLALLLNTLACKSLS